VKFYKKFFSCCLLSLSTLAQSFQDKDLTFSLGAGNFFKPRYEGSQSYESQPLPYVSLNYQDLLIINPYQGMVFNYWHHENITLGVGLDYNYGREESDNIKFQGLGNIDDAMQLKLTGKYQYLDFNTEMTVAKDIIDGHDGYTVTPEFNYSHTIPDYYAFIKLGVKANYANSGYMQSYFGVSPAQASRSSYAPYYARPGWKDITLNAFAMRYLAKQWSVNGNIGYKFLLGDAATSPLVEDRNQYYFITFVAYHF
jgi:outer membrane protein